MNILGNSPLDAIGQTSLYRRPTWTPSRSNPRAPTVADPRAPTVADLRGRFTGQLVAIEPLTGHFYGHLEPEDRRRFIAEAHRVAPELVVIDSAPHRCTSLVGI